MKLVIVVYDGVDIFDIALPYELMRQASGVEVTVACNTGAGEIVCKDKSLTLSSLQDLREIKSADVLWICQGEATVDALLKDDRFKVDVARLALEAKRVVAVGAASMFLVGTCIDEQKTICTHPQYARAVKKAKLNYSSDLILLNEDFITMSARASALIAAFMLIDEFAGADERDRLFLKYNFDKSMLGTDFSADDKRRQKLLKKLYKQTLKRGVNVKDKTLLVDSNEKNIAFYVQEGFNVLSFGVLYGILSNYQQLSTYVVGDKKGEYTVEGGGFKIYASYATQQIKRVNTLVITGGDVIDDRLGDTYLKYWLSELAPKTSMIIAVDGADRLLGVSGVLAEYDPVIEGDDGNGKFVLYDNLGMLMNWLRRKLPLFSNETQAELMLSEYFFLPPY